MLAAGLADRVVLFPPVDRVDLYQVLAGHVSPRWTELRSMSFYAEHKIEGPVAVALENRFLVSPDAYLKPDGTWMPSPRPKCPLFLFERGHSAAQILWHCSPEEAEKLSKRPDVSRYKLGGGDSVMIATNLTGLPTGKGQPPT